MKSVKPIKLSDDSIIFVEVEDEEIESLPENSKHKNLPPGSELTSATDKMRDAVKILKDTFSSTAAILHEAIDKSKPAEWTLEINVGFKGKTHPIPVLLSGEANAAIKVSVKWKKAEEVKHHG